MMDGWVELGGRGLMYIHVHVHYITVGHFTAEQLRSGTLPTIYMYIHCTHVYIYTCCNPVLYPLYIVDM